MGYKLKTFWLNIGLIDRDLAVHARLQVLQALAKEKIEVRSNFNYIHSSIVNHGLFKVWFLQHRGKGFLGNIWLFFKQQLVLAKNIDVDVVVLRYSNLHQTLPLWFLWRKILRRDLPKFVLDVRSLAVDLSKNWRGKLEQIRWDTSVRFAFRHFDGLTMITKKMKKDLQTGNNNFDKKICVWSSGVDPVLFNPNNSGYLKNKLGFQNRFVVMYHGIFSPNRGLQQVIEAISTIRKNHPKVLFFLLGSGPAQFEFENLIKKLELEKHIFIHPPVHHEEVPKYIKLAQAGILPFPDLDWWNTSSPIKLMEYLAMGKPVIVTDIEAHRAVLGELKCGFFVRDHEPDSLACGIKAVIEKSSELPDIGRIARKTAIENLTWEKQARKIKAYFQNLVKEDLDSSI